MRCYPENQEGEINCVKTANKACIKRTTNILWVQILKAIVEFSKSYSGKEEEDGKGKGNKDGI